MNFLVKGFKGLTLYPEKDGLITTYWTVPESERPKEIKNWMKALKEGG